MNGWLLLVIAIIFGVAGYIEFRRVPSVQAWAVRHGSYVTSSPDIQLQAAMQSDAAAYGTAGGWGFGLVLTREMTSAHLRVVECRMRLTKGTAWHIVSSMSSDRALNEAELREHLSKSLPGREVAVDEQRVVWRRRGLLWPGRLDEIYSEADQVEQAIRAARRE